MLKDNFVSLEKEREGFLPELPKILEDLFSLDFVPSDRSVLENDPLKAFFPLTFGKPFLELQKGVRKEGSRALKVGVVFSGGQAPGGHNVITGLYDSLKTLHPHSQLFGFLNGPEGILLGNYKELHLEGLQAYRNQGGFDLLGSGRTKIEKEDQLNKAFETLQKISPDGLVIIGGDDSNTNAAALAEYCLKKGSGISIVGVPKTIDGDLMNACVQISFGFDTACKVYSEMIGNIARDALSSKKYFHFIKLMGRSASHIVLECALKTCPNLALIGEEIAAQKKSLKQIVKEIGDLVCKRSELGKNFGVILVPEGLIEMIPECKELMTELNSFLARDDSCSVPSILAKLSSQAKDLFSSFPQMIQEQLLLSRDSHGNVQVSKIETESLLIELIAEEIKTRMGTEHSAVAFSPVRHFLGYEGRSGFPSNFDCNYTYSLGFAASLLIEKRITGYMAAVTHLTHLAKSWSIEAAPLAALMHLEMRKGKEKPVIEKKCVCLNSQAFLRFCSQREEWKWEEKYTYPGPIQFYGSPFLTEAFPLTLLT